MSAPARRLNSLFFFLFSFFLFVIRESMDTTCTLFFSTQRGGSGFFDIGIKLVP